MCPSTGGTAEAGSGKSHLTGLLVERWITAGYTVLVVDPEGDHTSLGRLHHTIVIDRAAADRSTAANAARPVAVRGAGPVRARRQRAQAYLQTVAGAVEVIRSLYGLPHWILVDEAHGPLGEDGSIAHLFRPTGGGYCYVTYHPDALCAAARTTIDLTLTTLGPNVPAAGPAEALVRYRPTECTEVTVRIDARTTPHVRHRHKYLRVPLAPHRRFVFRDPAGQPLATAATIDEFTAQLGSIRAESIQHHVAHGNFSRWLVGVLQDRELGAHIAGQENELNARLATDITRFRTRVLARLPRRYLREDNPAADSA